MRNAQYENFFIKTERQKNCLFGENPDGHMYMKWLQFCIFVYIIGKRSEIVLFSRNFAKNCGLPAEQRKEAGR